MIGITGGDFPLTQFTGTDVPKWIGPQEGTTYGTYNGDMQRISGYFEQIQSGELIADGAITANKIADNAVGVRALAPDSVGIKALAPGGVTTDKIADGAVGVSKIADGAVGTTKIADNAVGVNALAAGSVGIKALAAGGVTSTAIASGAVTTSKIADGAVTYSQMASDSVGVSTLKENSVGVKALAPGGVTSTAIANGAVTANKISSDYCPFPKNSIYMSISPDNPNTLWPGTAWSAWGTGRVPVGVDTSQTEFATVQKTGGAKTHTLTLAQMPSDGSKIVFSDISTFATGSSMSPLVAPTGTRHKYTYGGGQGHNNLQPYITCYMWRRTA